MISTYTPAGPRRSRVRTALAVTALTGGLVAGALTALPAHALFDGDGRHVSGVGAESAGGFWLGAYAPPGNVERQYPVWCTHMWRANPQPSDTASIATLTDSKKWGPDDIDLTTPQMAWLLNKYQSNTSANNRAALSYLIHANFEGDQAGRNTQESVNLLVQKVKEQAGDIHALAAQYTTEARNSAAVGYEGGTVEGDGKREGVINGVGVNNERHGFIADIPITLTLNGPAVFKNTGTNKWEGTSQAAPLNLEWEATGNGAVTYVMRAQTKARRTLTKYGVDGSIQDTLSYGNRPISDPEFQALNGPQWRVIYDFQPVATSNVGDAKIVDGNTISDTLTASADPAYGDGQWLELDGVPVPVTYEGAAYLTGELPADETADVPAGVEPVATTSLTFNGPGTQTATVDVPEGTDPGFITWVWRVVKANQTTEVSANGRTYPASEFVHANWSDRYGLADETGVRRFAASIDTSILVRETQSGVYLSDDIWVNGFPENHGEWAGTHGFKADEKNLKQELFFFREDLPVTEANKAHAELIASVTVPAKNGYYPSVGSTKFKAKPGNPGTYVFVTSFPGDDRVKPLTTSVEDKTEQYTVEGPIPTLKTSATDATDGDKELPSHGPVTINDHVCYTGLKPGKEYTLSGVLMDKATAKPIHVDGKDITATETFIPTQAEGCTDIQFTVDATHLIGKTLVVFESLTREGRQVAVHADINDQDQTIPGPGAPTVGTTATDAKDGDKNVTAEAKATINDKVCYTNLTPGKEYTLSGVLMDKATGQPLLVGGQEVRASKTFTAKDSKGCEVVSFTFDASTLAKKTLVVFEDLLHDGTTIATHADINDQDQTVTIIGGDEDKGGAGRSKALARTGADTVGVLIGALALAGVGYTIRRLHA